MRPDKKPKRMPCHRIPERSFVVDGFQSFFCQRCIGIYLGFLFGTIFIILTSGFHIVGMDISIIIITFPMAYDWLSQVFKKRESNNVFRFTTGLMFGLGFAPIFLLSKYGTAFNSNNYLIFVLVLAVVMMSLQRKLGKKSVLFVKAVSWLSVLSIFIGFFVVSFFIVRTAVYSVNFISSLLFS
jgi:uncharacterized membrane protein